MSNINDYIQSCAGQTPMSAGSYNEMDALVFANLSYIKFDEVKDTALRQRLIQAAGSDGIGLQEYAQIMLDSGVEAGEKKHMLEEICHCGRYANCRIANCMSTDQKTGTQWAAITIKLDETTSVVSFRGTDSTKEGWAEDFELGYSEATGAQKESADYLKMCEADHVYLTGHSKGGNDAVSAYIMADHSVRDKVKNIYNFDGPGVNDAFADTYKEGYTELDDKLVTIYPKDSVIGTLLKNHPGKHVYVETSAENMIQEHDSYTWQMKNGADGSLIFDNTDQSEISQYIDRVLDDTLNSLPPEKREKFLRALIEIGVPDLIAHPESLNLDKIELILYNSGELDFETKSAILKTFSALLVWAGMNGINYDADILSNDLLDQALQTYLDILAFQLGIWLNANGDLLIFVTDIILKISETVRSIVEGFVEFLNEVGQRIKGFFDGTYTDTSIQINASALTEAANTMKPAAQRLEQCREEIVQIRQRIGAWAGVYVIQLIVQESQIGSLESSCRKFVNALNDIAGIYTGTENEIMEYL